MRVTGPTGRGTGYLLDGGLLLTSAETAGATSGTVTFRFPGSDRPWQCALIWHRYDPTLPRAMRLDAALLRVLDADWDEHQDRLRALRQPPSSPPRWGRLTTRRASVPVSLTAFPGEDALVVHGTVSAESAVKSGRYRVTLPDPASRRDPEAWPGVPGAALLCHGLVLGVVADAVREPGTAWLSVVPAETLLRDSAFRAETAAGPVEAAELQPVLDEGPTPAQEPEPSETDALTRWCEAPNLFSARLVVGADDDRRRRLARSLVRRMSGREWAAGCIGADADRHALGVVTDTFVPTLVVLDRADTRRAVLLDLLDALARRALTGPAAPVRLLLLAPDAGQWWRWARAESPVLRDLPADTVLSLPGNEPGTHDDRQAEP
ncbi:hypothetical protein SsS58_05704 [Streptomyces scabiei]|uniref:Uncharacterized protein n=1 Tax=Streptomyces scabiei TaxID=1930 RepID=A0A100JTA7_STRSC|nr:hypothetical protein SsS58_05704 [Streptomyces scabiei]